MEDKKKIPVAKALTDDQLEHTEKNVEIIVDHTVLPDVVTDALPVRGRF